MSLLVITDANGTRTVDIKPIESYAEELESKVGPSPGILLDDQLQRVRAMSKEQLEHLAFLLTSKVAMAAWLYAESFKPPHARTVEDLMRLREAAKTHDIDLWPELEG